MFCVLNFLWLFVPSFRSSMNYPPLLQNATGNRRWTIPVAILGTVVTFGAGSRFGLIGFSCALLLSVAAICATCLVTDVAATVKAWLIAPPAKRKPNPLVDDVPTRWRRFGRTLIGVQSDRIVTRNRYGAPEVIKVIGYSVAIFALFGGMSYFTFHTHPGRRSAYGELRLLTAALGFISGYAVAGIVKVFQVQPVLRVKGNRILAYSILSMFLGSSAELEFGSLNSDEVEVAVIEHPVGYQVRLEMRDNPLVQFRTVIAVPSLDDAEGIADIVRGWLTECEKTVVWPPPPEMASP